MASISFTKDGKKHQLIFVTTLYPACCGATIISNFSAMIGEGYSSTSAIDLESPEAIAAGKEQWTAIADKVKQSPQSGYPAGCGVFLSAVTTDAQEDVARFFLNTGWVELGQGKNYSRKLRMFGFTRTDKADTHEPLPVPKEDEILTRAGLKKAGQPAYVANSEPVDLNKIVMPEPPRPPAEPGIFHFGVVEGMKFADTPKPKAKRAPRKLVRAPKEEAKPPAFTDVYPVEAWKLPKRANKL